MTQKTLLYFLSYADSIEDSIAIGHMERLVRELDSMARSFDVTVFSKDNPCARSIMQKYISAPLSYRGTPCSIYGTRWSGRIRGPLRKVCSGIAFLVYQVFSPFIFLVSFRKADVFYARHVSSALAGVIAKAFVNRRLMVVARIYWSWSNYNLKESGRPLFLVSRALERFIARRCDHLIVASQTSRETLQRDVKGTRVQIAIMPNWVDTELFKPQVSPAKEYDFVYVGRFAHDKNPLLFLEAVEALRLRRHARYRVLCIGRGALREEAGKYAESHDMHVTFIDSLPNKEVARALNKAKIYCISSRHEGCPKALLEAMSCGLLCVGTSVQGITDIIRDGDNGFLAAPEAGAFSQALEKALSCYDACDVVRRKAVDHVAAHYGFKKVMSDIVTLLGGVPS
jgi:glycosyltransferase involved in cell wall biosynthesis